MRTRTYTVSYLLGLAILLFGTSIVFAQAQPVPIGPEVKKTLSSVVGVAAFVPAQSRTASILGRARRGSGVVVAENLVLTVGYVILEASNVVVFAEEDQPVKAEVVAYDSHSGLGLIRTTEPLSSPSIVLGDSDTLGPMSPALVASFGTPRVVSPTIVVARDEFTGYWEYLIDRAITTTPAYPGYAGASLLGPTGDVLGIGSLQMQFDEENTANLFIPINDVKTILSQLLERGKIERPARPWLGAYAAEREGQVVIVQVADDSPAFRADLIVGDKILAVGKTQVHTLSEYFRALWALGPAGVIVPLTIDGLTGRLDVEVPSVDRQAWYDAVAPTL